MIFPWKPSYVHIVAGVSLFLLVIGYHVWYGHSRYQAGKDAAELEMNRYVIAANDRAEAAERAAAERIEEVEATHESHIADLNNRLAAALARAPVVRVQKCPDSGAVSEAAKPAGERSQNGQRQ